MDRSRGFREVAGGDVGVVVGGRDMLALSAVMGARRLNVA